jgi:hypothetical protein
VTAVLWAYFGIAASGWAVYVTVIAIIGMYPMPAFLLLGKLRRNRGLITIAARNLPAGKLNGIPSEVYRIHRLEKHWYAATFYTDDVWDQCTNRTVP